MNTHEMAKKEGSQKWKGVYAIIELNSISQSTNFTLFVAHIRRKGLKRLTAKNVL